MNAHRYTATVTWRLEGDADFQKNRYSRRHSWRFDGGVHVPASSSPQVVPEPMSDPKAIDPEEAFVAALSSCHMLWFLSIAARRGFVVQTYTDEAEGTMEKNMSGKTAITRVFLRPTVTFAEERTPDDATHAALHEEAHDACFLANSVRTEILCQPTKASNT